MILRPYSRLIARIEVQSIDELSRLKIGLGAMQEAGARFQRDPYRNGSGDHLALTAQELKLRQLANDDLVIGRRALKLLVPFGDDIQRECGPVLR